ncbi:acyltransferase family protein [Silvibacterium dinghuense]|uniref:Acyltransferase n=1 Tax=Silvibacterium dinghuense TaxID=1560006 RepID=A0A4Q1SE07_9BACT|nr:acyltransferase [Silvibacterium dinghuense]RXS95148.1 acyltransferase [Silvibacterium dinghuense]GGH11041.1 LPS biosynthesis protein [Silvibacterium dinghuense]
MSDSVAPSHRRLVPNLTVPHGAASAHLDALRGIAAVGVCANHLRDTLLADYSTLPHHNPALTLLYLASGLGHQWVMIFFVLSGYLVGGSVLRSFSAGRWSWRGYLLNRLSRLYMVLLPALLLGGAFDLLGLHLFGSAGLYGGRSGSHELTTPVAAHLHLTTLAGNYLYLQGILVPVFGSNGPLWSLANEFWYYLAFPLLLLAFLPKVRISARMLHGIVLAAILWFVGPFIAVYFLAWLAGAAIHYLPRLPVAKPLSRTALIVCFAVALALCLAWCKQTHFHASDAVLTVFTAALVYVVLSCAQGEAALPYQTVAHWLSRSSYTLYLVHLPLIVFLVSATGRIRLAPDAQQLLLALGIFAMALLYAQTLWFCFEKRTDSLREALRPYILPVRTASSSVLRP